MSLRNPDGGQQSVSEIPEQRPFLRSTPVMVRQAHHDRMERAGFPV